MEAIYFKIWAAHGVGTYVHINWIMNSSLEYLPYQTPHTKFGFLRFLVPTNVYIGRRCLLFLSLPLTYLTRIISILKIWNLYQNWMFWCCLLLSPRLMAHKKIDQPMIFLVHFSHQSSFSTIHYYFDMIGEKDFL